jgi:hypothetical protein
MILDRNFDPTGHAMASMAFRGLECISKGVQVVGHFLQGVRIVHYSHIRRDVE